MVPHMLSQRDITEAIEEQMKVLTLDHDHLKIQKDPSKEVEKSKMTRDSTGSKSENALTKSNDTIFVIVQNWLVTDSGDKAGVHPEGGSPASF